MSGWNVGYRIGKRLELVYRHAFPWMGVCMNMLIYFNKMKDLWFIGVKRSAGRQTGTSCHLRDEEEVDGSTKIFSAFIAADSAP